MFEQYAPMIIARDREFIYCHVIAIIQQTNKLSHFILFLVSHGKSAAVQQGINDVVAFSKHE